MTEQQKTAAQVGDLLTVTGSISLALTPEGGRVYPRGTVLTVTEEWLEASRDRNGSSYLDNLDPAEQIARWGAVKFVFGDRSEEILWWNETPGDSAWNYARELEQERIATISDPVDRFEAQEAARQKFGRKPTSTVLATYAPDAPGVHAPQDIRGARR